MSDLPRPVRLEPLFGFSGQFQRVLYEDGRETVLTTYEIESGHLSCGPALIVEATTDD